MKNITAVISCSLFLWIIAGCSGSDSRVTDSNKENSGLFIDFADVKNYEADWSKENVLVIHIPAEPPTLHPSNIATANGMTISKLVHGFLLIQDIQSQQLIPGIVKSMPEVSADQLTYSYELLDEVAWDDGSPVTAEDVIFSLKAYKCALTNNPNVKPYLENLREIVHDPSNPKKFTLVMKSPYIQNLAFLSDLPIVNRRYFDPGDVLSQYSFQQFNDSSFNAEKFRDLVDWSVGFNDAKYGSDPAFLHGMGMYKLTKWDRGQTIVLEKKTNHWSQRTSATNVYMSANPGKIIFKMIKDENAMLLESKSQTIDASSHFPTKVLLDLREDSSFNRNYNSAFMLSYGCVFYHLNTRPDGVKRKKIFDDIRVRQAMAKLIPVDDIITILLMGQAVRWPAMVSPLKKGEYNSDLPLIAYDVEGAKKLLDEAGWVDSDGDGVREKVIDGKKTDLDIEFLHPSQGNIAKDLATMITEAAMRAGMKITPQTLDLGGVQQKGREHDFDMLSVSVITNSQQQDYTQNWHTSAWMNKGSNYSGFGNASSDALIDSIKFTMNDSLRNAMSWRLQKMIYDAQPCIFTYSPYRKVVIHKRWGNQVMTAEAPSFIPNNLKLLSPQVTAALLSE